MFNVTIKNRSAKVAVKNPDPRTSASRPKVWVKDESPMSIGYLSYPDAIEGATSVTVRRVLKDNPDATISFPEGCGIEPMKLSEWVATAPARDKPERVEQHPERMGLPLGEKPDSVLNSPFNTDAPPASGPADTAEKK